jgi:hypothetical protein
MARINIPSSEYAVLKDLAGLPQASFSELHSAMVEIEPTVRQIDVATLLSKKVTSVDAADVKAFLRTAFSLYRMMDAKERTAEEIAGDIRETVKRDQPKGFPIDKLDLLIERIQKLLGVGGLIAIAAKAVNVMLEQNRIFCGARVLSDIRPVFVASPDSVSAALLTHSLNITFHEAGEQKEFFVALTTSELQSLKKAVERAEKKAETLKALIQQSGVKFFSDGD